MLPPTLLPKRQRLPKPPSNKGMRGWRTPASLLVPLAALALLAGCGSGGASAPGGVSQSEAKALEDAAEMLDERQLPPEAVPPEAAPAQMTGDSAPPRGE
jgi:hypothetical protein